MKEEKQGVIADIIFHNQENGYTIAVFETEDEQFTAVGNLPSCHKGRSYLLRGQWKIHPTYGEQFAISSFEEVMPSTEEGIEEFLSSGVLKGIGKKTAAAIVARFGSETFAVIENQPHRLTEIPGIGEKKAESVAEAFRSHREFAEITLYLQQFGINADYAMKLYRVYGADTIAGMHDINEGLFSEEYQTAFLKAYSQVFDELPYITGEHIWNFADFATAENIKRVQGNKKGIFTRTREPKMAAFFIKERWNKMKEKENGS